MADDLDRGGEPHIAHAYRAAAGRGCAPRPELGLAPAACPRAACTRLLGRTRTRSRAWLAQWGHAASRLFLCSRGVTALLLGRGECLQRM